MERLSFGRLNLGRLLSKLAEFGRLAGAAARLMVGVPDYGQYVEHRKTCHPGAPIMSREEFFRERQSARYGGKNRINRCC
jgi:uncharacterized short protein YbdD (DUF466 family)